MPAERVQQCRKQILFETPPPCNARYLNLQHKILTELPQAGSTIIPWERMSPRCFASLLAFITVLPPHKRQAPLRTYQDKDAYTICSLVLEKNPVYQGKRLVIRSYTSVDFSLRLASLCLKFEGDD